MAEQLLNELLEPIPGGHPGGADLAYLKEYDEIREARRADDPGLAQGAWVTEVKAAQWPLVRELCEKALREKSKDFQLAGWYTEAMTRLDGFAGLDIGLKLFNGLMTDFWEFAFPELDQADLEERISKFEWLDTQLPHVLRSVPMTSGASGGYSWLQWEESRSVENLGMKDAQAKELALAEGKISAETFDKAAKKSGAKFYENLVSQLQAVRDTHAELEAHVDRAFGKDAPSLRTLRETIAACLDLAQRLATKTGAKKVAPTPVEETTPAPATMNETPAMAAQPEGSIMNAPQFSGPIRSRAEAVNQLREIARFFRDTEPHSPVSLLADRAAKWAEMPLEQWLSSVIKDDNTLGQLRELLDWEQSGSA